MTVEDGILILETCIGATGLFVKHRADSWATSFVHNVSEHVGNGKPLSTEQGRIILKLLTRVRLFLVAGGHVEESALDRLLARPTYAQEPTQTINVPREVRYLGEGFVGFRFKRNDAITADLKAMVRDQDFPFDDIWFHPPHRLWVVPVNRDTLVEVLDTIERHRFQCDATAREYLESAARALGENSSASTDHEIGLTAIQVRDDEMLSWIVREVLRAEPV